MTASVQGLRDRLHAREHALQALRKRVAAARQAAAAPAATTISDIQRRYLSAVAGAEQREKEAPRPRVGGGTDAVASLASRWNKGIEGKEVVKTRVDVRADVRGVQKNFNAKDAPKMGAGEGRRKKVVGDVGPAELEVEDEDAGLPSWAVNQAKKTIRKENARSSVRDVDVRELQGTVLESAAKGEAETKGEAVEAKGNVKAALAMWGKSAEEDTAALKKKKEEEERLAKEQARLKKEQEEAEKARREQAAVTKFAKLSLRDLGKEPADEIELVAFLERKIALVEKDIEEEEKELEKLESAA